MAKSSTDRFGTRNVRSRTLRIPMRKSRYFSRFAVNCTSEPGCTVISLDQSL